MNLDEVILDLDVKREDFAKNTDVIPVSDPHIFSETQRMAQTQAVITMMKENPDLFDRRAVIMRFMKQIKVPQINELVPDAPSPEKLDAANENVAMTIGRAAFAYPEQDHLGHIQTHLDYAKDPVLGANPVIAPGYIPKVIEHIKQHLALWYLSRMNGYVQKAMGRKLEDYDLLADPKPVDKLFGAASQHVMMDTKDTLSGIMPVIQQLVQSAQQYQPKPQLTPDGQVLLQTSMAETERRKARDEAEMTLKSQDLQGKMELAQAKQMDEKDIAIEELQLRLAIARGDNDMKERIETARLTRDAARLNFEERKTVNDFSTRQEPTNKER
jgi:hypothetical protein